jgi:hypothetical protein
MDYWLQITSIVSQVATSVGVLIALIIFAYDARKDRKSREYESFLTLLARYDKLVEERKEKWQKIKKALLENEKTKHEVHDKQNTIGYLMIRIKQVEPLFAVEYELVGNEIQSLNFLNELCHLAAQNEQAKTILILTNSDEITFYQKNIKQLVEIYETAKMTARLFKPKAHFIIKTDVSDWFEQTKPNE